MSAIVVCPDCTTGPMGYAGNVYWRRCATHTAMLNSAGSGSVPILHKCNCPDCKGNH